MLPFILSSNDAALCSADAGDAAAASEEEDDNDGGGVTISLKLSLCPGIPPGGSFLFFSFIKSDAFTEGEISDNGLFFCIIISLPSSLSCLR